MKKTVLFAAVAVIFVFTGCTTYYRDAGADYLMRPEAAGSTPYYTDYALSNKRVTAKGEASVLLGFFQIAENKRCLSVINPNLSFLSFLSDMMSPTFKAVSNAKGIALYNACTEHNADQLLGVTFDYVVKDYLLFAKVDCVVRGFPARVKGIKRIEKKPIILNKWQKIEYVAPYENPVAGDNSAKPVLSFESIK